MRRTGLTSDRLPLPILLLTAACATGPADAAAPSPETAAREIVAMLESSAEAWNRGDLDGYLADYAEDATFVGSSGLIRGSAEIRRRYVDGYWRTGTPEDALRFEILDVRVTGPETATTVGRYILYDRDSRESTGTGVFTLALARIGGQWKILHDHSSADAQD